MIRLPMNKNADFLQVQGAKARLEAAGDYVTLEDIARECSMSQEDVKELLGYAGNVASLDTPITEGEGGTYGDFIESNIPGPEAEVVEKSLSESIDRILDSLSERERNVIIRRYGLHDTKPMSLKEVGDLYGLTKERIRQIEKKVLNSMKEDSEIRELRAYIA